MTKKHKDYFTGNEKWIKKLKQGYEVQAKFSGDFGYVSGLNIECGILTIDSMGLGVLYSADDCDGVLIDGVEFDIFEI